MAGDRFGAFISYARAASSTLALDLQNGLERFAKPWNKLRAVRIFRDDASMSANTALWSTIQRALEQSEWFVLLATPQAAASEYVNDEVTWWVTHKGADKLLLVHAGGTVDWDDDAGDFSAASDAIPAALKGAYKEEPRWVDVTWYGQAGSLQRADPRFVERVADLSATVRGIERDVLLGENVTPTSQDATPHPPGDRLADGAPRHRAGRRCHRARATGGRGPATRCRHRAVSDRPLQTARRNRDEPG